MDFRTACIKNVKVYERFDSLRAGTPPPLVATAAASPSQAQHAAGVLVAAGLCGGGQGRDLSGSGGTLAGEDTAGSRVAAVGAW